MSMISKTTQYAIRALIYIQTESWKKRRSGVIEIANEIEAPVPYTAKILQILSKNQVIYSMKGRGGGFYFLDNQPSLTIYSIIHLMEGDSSFQQCGVGLTMCNHDNPCPFHEKYARIREEFELIARSETIQIFSEKIQRGEAVLKHIIEN